MLKRCTGLAHPQQQYPQVSSRGSLCFYFGGMDVDFKAALKTRWTPWLRETLTSEWCVDFFLFRLSFSKTSLLILCCHILRNKWTNCETADLLYRCIFLSPSLSMHFAGWRRSCPQLVVLKVCSAPLTDLTKQLRDISVFTAATRNIL